MSNYLHLKKWLLIALRGGVGQFEVTGIRRADAVKQGRRWWLVMLSPGVSWSAAILIAL